MFCFACGKQLPEEAAFCLSCGVAMPSAVTGKGTQKPVLAPLPAPGTRNSHRGAVVGAGVVLLVLVAGTVISTRSKKGTLGYAPDVILTPMTDRIVSGAVTVPAGGHLDFRFDVDPSSMRDARVVGHFLCTGGAGNDIVAVLAEEKEFAKWIDGQVANVYYTSRGKVTTGALDAQITRPGTYYLSFSNRFSTFSAKTISAEIDLEYSKVTIR
jgi:hypothetical protein